MTSTLQIVDSAGAVEFDLNGANTVAGGTFTCKLGPNPNWGSPTQDALRFMSPSFDGGSTAYRRAALTPSTLPLVITASSYDVFAAGIGILSRLLAAGCTMKWSPDGSSNTRFADIEPTETPVLFNGQELALYDATQRFAADVNPITLSLLRQPYFRGSELDPTVNLLKNPTLLRDTAQDARPDSWSWSATTNITNEAIVDDGLDSAFQFDIATGSTRQFLQTSATSTVATGETWTMSGYARVTSASMTNAKVQAMIEFQQSGGTAVNTATGTLSGALTTAWTRVTVSGVAGASVSKAQFGLRMDNDDATSATVQFQRFQAEEAAAATTFRTGVETPSNDPTVAPGRVVMFWNEGDAPAPVRCYFAGSTAEYAVVGVANHDAQATYANYPFQQAESMTQGTDTSTQTVGATASGSSADVSRTTFTTNTLAVLRLTWTLTASQLAGVAGSTWQLWARVQETSVGDEFDLQATYAYEAGAASPYDLPTTSFEANIADWHDVNLGTLSVPSDASALQIKLYAQRTTGSGSIDWDFLHFVPANQAGYHGTSGKTWSLLETNPEIPRVAAVTAGHLVSRVMEAHGPVPFVAEPGPNAVYVLRTGQTVNASEFYNDTLAASDVSFYYSPRYHA